MPTKKNARLDENGSSMCRSLPPDNGRNDPPKTLSPSQAPSTTPPYERYSLLGHLILLPVAERLFFHEQERRRHGAVAICQAGRGSL